MHKNLMHELTKTVKREARREWRQRLWIVVLASIISLLIVIGHVK